MSGFSLRRLNTLKGGSRWPAWGKRVIARGCFGGENGHTKLAAPFSTYEISRHLISANFAATVLCALVLQ